jgi:hypothetical protein
MKPLLISKKLIALNTDGAAVAILQEVLLLKFTISLVVLTLGLSQHIANELGTVKTGLPVWAPNWNSHTGMRPHCLICLD